MACAICDEVRAAQAELASAVIKADLNAVGARKIAAAEVRLYEALKKAWTNACHHATPEPHPCSDWQISAIRLHTEAGSVFVSVEINGVWVNVIKESGSIISHIVERSGIDAARGGSHEGE